MNKKLVVTYAVLAYLKETSDCSNTSIFELYIPLIKKGLSVYSDEHDLTQIMGSSLSEIQDKISEVFDIIIPIPVLYNALRTIEKQINDDNVFKIYGDKSFVIKSYVFSDIDEIVRVEQENIASLEKDFSDFCKENDCLISFDELIDFIKAQEIDLFTIEKSNFLEVNSLLPKYLDKVIKEKGSIYQIICNLYLGSLLASYFALSLDKVSTNVRLLIDTNFFISLIDLNTEDAFSVCNQVFDLCKQMGYQFYILESTIRQIDILLNNRIQDFGNKDFIGTVRTADIFSACIRRHIQKTELEAIKDSVRRKLADYEIGIIFDAQVRDLIESAKKQDDFKSLRERRGNSDSALNDIVARLYVERHRGSGISDFSDVKCWFLHNSYSPYEYSSNKKICERWSIGANELLVLLWLANPAQEKKIKTEIVVNGGIASYITKYRCAKIPSTKVLKAIKQKIDNAVSLGVVDEKTIYNLTIRMSEGSVDMVTTDILAEQQGDIFVSKLNEFKDIDKIKDNKIDELKRTLEISKNEREKQSIHIQQQQKHISVLEEAIRELQQDKYDRERTEYIARKMRVCRIYTVGYVVLVGVVITLWVINYLHLVVQEPWATIISLVLFIALTFGLPFINHTTIIEFFCRKKLKSRLGEEFDKKHNKR